ncbi:patatin-like phospholipase family protein [Cryobacterium sp. AP23]
MAAPVEVRAIAAPAEVRYLVFGGGGGRGWAHIGAIKKLERLTRAPLVQPTRVSIGPRRDFPLPNQPPGSGIRGCAGASIGAFIAMCVALGATHSTIRKLAEEALGQRQVGAIMVPALLDDERFAVTTQPPGTSNLHSRPAVRDGQFAYQGTSTPTISTEDGFAEYLKLSLLELVGGLGSPGALIAADLLESARPHPMWMLANMFHDDETSNFVSIANGIRLILDGRLAQSDRGGQFRVFTRDAAAFRTYLASFLEGEGILPGWALHRFVTDALKTLGKPLGLAGSSKGLTTFRDLYLRTNVELAVSATQVLQRRGRLFSYRTTPDFGIVPAVCMSMAFPLLFKPVSVSQSQGGTRVMPDHYNGRYLDGGMVNNLPLRAFTRPTSLSLHPRTLAFALFEDPDFRSGTTIGTSVAQISREVFGILADQPMNSQFLLETDGAQVVPLRTSELSTFDFVDRRTGDIDRAIDTAYRRTGEYFEAPPKINTLVTAWSTGQANPNDVDPDFFEAMARAQFRRYFPVVSPAPLYVRTRGGRFSIDLIVGTSMKPDTWRLVEAKAGSSGLSKAQSSGHPVFAKTGGLLINQKHDGRTNDDDEWRPFIDELRLPPTKVVVTTPVSLRSDVLALVR